MLSPQNHQVIVVCSGDEKHWPEECQVTVLWTCALFWAGRNVHLIQGGSWPGEQAAAFMFEKTGTQSGLVAFNSWCLEWCMSQNMDH